jgi:hypothetical protein
VRPHSTRNFRLRAARCLLAALAWAVPLHAADRKTNLPKEPAEDSFNLT